MEWNLKAQPSWDFTELEQQQQQTFTNLENSVISVSNSFIDQKPMREEFSVDLKLGRVANSGKESIPKTPSKRSRGSHNGSQRVSCLVDGCEADLSGCRDYHRRHKVCEVHSKTSQVTIAGHNQRFCQQCSRFHGLEEFDEGKRSCRKRLDGHNRRRRKPQQEPFSRYGNLLSNYQGNQLLPFSSSLVYPSVAVVDPTWAGVVVKTEAIDSPQNGLFLNPSSSSSSSSPFPFFQSHHSLQRPSLSSDRGKLGLYGKSSSAMEVQNSECALSLLSSSAQITEMGLGHNNNNQNDMSSQFGSNIPLLNSGGLDLMSSVLVSNGSEMFHYLGSDGSSSNQQSHQSLHSHWG